MVKLKIKSGSEARVKKLIQAKAERIAGEVVGKVAEGVFEFTPVDAGHAHAAWIAGFRKVQQRLPNSERISMAIQTAQADSSEDPEAVNAGNGSVRKTKNGVTVTIRNGLGFVRKIEHGGQLVPISPGGLKTHGIKGPGPLFGPRQDAPPQGVLMFQIGGRTVFTRRATLPALRPVHRAVQQAKDWYRAKVKK